MPVHNIHVPPNLVYVQTCVQTTAPVRMIFERLAQSVVCKMEQNTENYVYLGHNFYFNLYFSNTSPHRQKNQAVCRHQLMTKMTSCGLSTNWSGMCKMELYFRLKSLNHLLNCVLLRNATVDSTFIVFHWRSKKRQSNTKYCVWNVSYSINFLFIDLLYKSSITHAEE